MRQAILLVGLAGLAAASPVVQQTRAILPRKLDDEKREKLSDEQIEEMEDFCNSDNYDLETSEGAEDVWAKTAGGQLDMYIDFVHDGGPENWLEDYEDFVHDGIGQKSDINSCSLLNSDCKAHFKWSSCEEYWYAAEEELKTGPWTKNAFWVFEAVEGLHSKLRTIRDEFERSVLYSSLQIDKMAEDFDGYDDETDGMFGWFKAALLMGGAVGSTIPAAGPWVGVAVGVLSPLLGQLVDEEGEDDGVDTASVQSALGGMGEHFEKVLQRNLKAALGRADNPDEDYDKLPAPLHDTFKTDIGKFFNGGFWILKDHSDEFQTLVESIRSNLKKKVAHNILKSAEWMLVADLDVEEDDCTELGQRWMAYGDDSHACFELSKGEYRSEHAAPDELYEKMDEHGLGRLEPFYEGLIACHESDKEDKNLVELEDLEFDHVPLCYFNMKTQKVVREKEKTGFAYKNVIKLEDLDY